MAQLKQVVEPFGEVNVYPAADNKTRVVATILMEPYKEGAQTGIALDGSGSMKKMYGTDDGSGVVSSIFKKKTLENEISPVAQQLCAYLARLDADGGTTCIYWSVGVGGQEVEVVGDFTSEEVQNHTFGPPREFGTGTYLLPAVRYFVDRFADAPWGFYVFITDGELFDLDEVKQYSTQLAKDIAARRRNPVKFILIGLGNEVNERQLEDLDDLDTGTTIDLWDHKLASELRMLQEIFAEVVDKNARVADNGKILDAHGNVVRNFSDTGLPAFIEFEIANNNDYFTLEVDGNRVHQALFDQAQVPASQLSQQASPPPQAPAAPPTPPAASQSPAPPQQPPAPPQPQKQEMIDDAGEVVSDDKDELWKNIDLDWDKHQ